MFNNSTFGNLPEGKKCVYTDVHCRAVYNSEISKQYPSVRNCLSVLYTWTMGCHVVTINYNKLSIDNERYLKIKLNRLQKTSFHFLEKLNMSIILQMHKAKLKWMVFTILNGYLWMARFWKRFTALFSLRISLFKNGNNEETRIRVHTHTFNTSHERGPGLYLRWSSKRMVVAQWKMMFVWERSSCMSSLLMAKSF